MRSDKFRVLPQITGVLFFVIVFFCGCGQADTYSYGRTMDLSEEAEVPKAAAGSDADGQNEAALQPAESIYVQVCGAVNCPGVYELTAGARVFEAIEKSGGLRQDAAPEAVNQAAEAVDGSMILIPTREQWETQTADTPTAGKASQDAAADGRVNINTADVQTLMTISGIGTAKAESIIAYRNEKGAFTSVEQIQNVTGIGDKLFQKIKDKIRV